MSIRAEVVGSLLRPDSLKEARSRVESGQMSAADFKREEDREVVAAIRLQEDAGIDVITDGELRRYAFYGHVVESFDGFDREGGWAIPFRDEKGEELVFREFAQEEGAMSLEILLERLEQSDEGS